MSPEGCKEIASSTSISNMSTPFSLFLLHTHIYLRIFYLFFYRMHGRHTNSLLYFEGKKEKFYFFNFVAFFVTDQLFAFSSGFIFSSAHICNSQQHKSMLKYLCTYFICSDAINSISFIVIAFFF